MAYNPNIIPVAVPVQADGTAFSASAPARPSLASTKSKYNLPSSRAMGDLVAVPEEQIQQLMKQGYTRGLAASLAQTIRTYPLRIWVVDNSGSMQHTDGHRFVETKSTNHVKVVSCSRWDEIKDCITYHAQMAAALEAPTTFRMLNDPAVGPNSQQFGIAENSLDKNVILGEVQRAIEIMKTAQPGGVTPLVEHILDIQQSVTELAPKLRADGCRVVIVLATDGLPTDDRGCGGQAIQEQFVQALRGLEGLPVWLVIRLCTDDEAVVNFYNELDGQLELSLEVLDDFLEEANEVYGHNPWVNYALPLHRLREMGYQHRSFDMLDERPFTHEELRDFCSLLLNNKYPSDKLPDPSLDW
jgi:Mg-chelatase subunit ChlD